MHILQIILYIIIIIYYIQILLLYDHPDDVQLIFEGCYQILILTIFLIRQLHDRLNNDKVCF